MIKDFFNLLICKLNLRLMNIDTDNRGIGSIEMVLLLLVILGIVVLFRDYIQALIKTIFAKVSSEIQSF